ncbi:glycosyltransferase family 4 protein [Azospira sp.]|jgi:glycogen synthase|uniref:glycosyltransferase family 4 protein n=1 Tax=Azospira sp. TaxID=1872671 RepID=UPI00255E9795|nr:glycosyltransferase family 4 protein [Azospira sp.]MDK9689839.1 glycosyltransferase family 4 protein [Azospira sp.]
MKILFVSNLFPPAHIGGYELACRDTVDMLIAAGHECHVLTSDFGIQPSIKVSDKAASYPIERVMQLHHNWGSPHIVSPFDTVQQHNLERLGEAITRIRPQVVYLWNLYGLGWKLLQVLDCVDAPPATFHFMDWSVMAYQRTVKRTLTSFRRLVPSMWSNVRPKVRNAVFISRFTRQQLNLSPTCSSVIYPYLRADDIPEKRDYRLGEKIKTVFIGQIEPHKGIFFLCEALRAYRLSSGRDVRLDVFGLSRTGKDISLREQFGDFVSVMTNVERSSLLRGLSEYDVGFFPSIWEEPFGIAQIEMMLAGLPVISTGRGGAGEVSNGHNLLLYQYDSQQNLNHVLHELLTHYEEMAPALGVQARQTVMQHHSLVHHQAALESHLRQVLSTDCTGSIA